jgi:hypothetical protein
MDISGVNCTFLWLFSIPSSDFFIESIKFHFLSWFGFSKHIYIVFITFDYYLSFYLPISIFFNTFSIKTLN